MDFGTPRGLEQYVWERFPGGIVRNDILSGPERLKAGRRTSQVEGSGERSRQAEGPKRRSRHVEGSENGPDRLKARRAVQTF